MVWLLLDRLIVLVPPQAAPRMAQGLMALLALTLVLAAKVAGTAIVARLFSLTQPALMRLAWFARLYGHWKPWKDALIARVKDSPIWRSTAANVHAIRQWIGI